ncbi:MAG TPA: hypothetical protein VF774_07170 [Pseudoduganella sp.]|jgi:hypothetical protein
MGYGFLLVMVSAVGWSKASFQHPPAHGSRYHRISWQRLLARRFEAAFAKAWLDVRGMPSMI